MKPPVCFFPTLDISGIVPVQYGFFRSIYNGLSEVRSSMTQGQSFKRCPHLGHLTHIVSGKTRNPNPTTGLTFCQTPLLEPSEGLSHRHMACTKFFSNVILQEFGTRFNFA